MSNDLSTILTYMEKERGVDREVLIEAVEYALQSAARKGPHSSQDLRVEIDRKTCQIRTFAKVTVVESESARISAGEVWIDKIRKSRPQANVGDVIELEVPAGNLGRIAAQTAKQAIIQKIRQAEKDRVFDEYKDRIGQIVSGTVRQFLRSDIIVDLGRAEAMIPAKERVPTEEYQVGDRVRALVMEVQHSSTAPGIALSRAHPDFVVALFKLEVSEIADGIVEIKAVAREPGYRTKIAVLSKDPKVDPVGACVGMRGMRVKNIVRELSGEKIDIIRWSDDLKTYVANALSPAKLLRVTIDDPPARGVHVVVDAEQLSLAIGKRGQNVRLTAKLLGTKVDVEKDESGVSFEEKVAKAVDNMAAIKGITREQAEALVKAGFLTVEGILAAELTELEKSTGFTAEAAKAVYDAAAATVPEAGE